MDNFIHSSLCVFKKKEQERYLSKEHKLLYAVNEVSLVYKNGRSREERQQIGEPMDCYNILKHVWDENRIELLEEFKIILLDRSLKCLGVSHISTGGVSGCVVDPKIIFATALKCHASGIVLSHNHPSGNLKPSQSDLDITEKISAIGALLDIQVHDHLILSSDGFISLGEKGLMPQPK